jgi:hypothetical protein
MTKIEKPWLGAFEACYEDGALVRVRDQTCKVLLPPDAVDLFEGHLLEAWQVDESGNPSSPTEGRGYMTRTVSIPFATCPDPDKRISEQMERLAELCLAKVKRLDELKERPAYAG